MPAEKVKVWGEAILIPEPAEVTMSCRSLEQRETETDVDEPGR